MANESRPAVYRGANSGHFGRFQRGIPPALSGDQEVTNIVVTLLVSFWVVAAAAIVCIAVGVVLSGLRIIGEDEAGLVIKRLGSTLASGRLIALEGEAGF